MVLSLGWAVSTLLQWLCGRLDVLAGWYWSVLFDFPILVIFLRPLIYVVQCRKCKTATKNTNCPHGNEMNGILGPFCAQIG